MPTARSHHRIRRREAGAAWLARRPFRPKRWNPGRHLTDRDLERLLARLDGSSVVERALPPAPSTVWLGDQHLATVLADLLGRALDRFPAARRVADDPPTWKVQAVRVGDCAHTLASPPGVRLLDTSQECLWCGEVGLYAGSGRCLSCAHLGRRYEVVA